MACKKEPRCSCKGKPLWGMWFEHRHYKQAHLELNLGLLCGGGAVFWLALVGMECTPSTGKKGHIVPVSAAQPQTASKSGGRGDGRVEERVLHCKWPFESLLKSLCSQTHTGQSVRLSGEVKGCVFLVHLKCLILFDRCLITLHPPSIIQHLKSVQVHEGPQSLKTNDCVGVQSHFWTRNQISHQ